MNPHRQGSFAEDAAPAAVLSFMPLKERAHARHR